MPGWRTSWPGSKARKAAMLFPRGFAANLATATPEAASAEARRALQIVEQQPERRQRLLERAARWTWQPS